MNTKTKQHGFTLLELMVALAVVSIMVVGFSTILATSRDVVSGSQRMMRANNSAAAIARIIRRDMRNVSKNGFLAYHYEDTDSTPDIDNSTWNDKYFLITTSAGVSPSTVSPDIGSGTITIYRDKENEASNRDDYLFCRQRWVLKSNPQRAITAGGDCWDADFSTIQTFPLSINTGTTPNTLDQPNLTDGIDNIQDLLGYLLFFDFDGNGQPDPISYPANSLDELRLLWQVLTPNCIGDTNNDDVGEGLVIYWWDSSGNYDMDTSSSDPGWSIVPAIWAKGKFFHDDDLDGVYEEDTTNIEWPAMFRIIYKMKDDSLESEVSENNLNIFELIVTVGQ